MTPSVSVTSEREGAIAQDVVKSAVGFETELAGSKHGFAPQAKTVRCWQGGLTSIERKGKKLRRKSINKVLPGSVELDDLVPGCPFALHGKVINTNKPVVFMQLCNFSSNSLAISRRADDMAFGRNETKAAFAFGRIATKLGSMVDNGFGFFEMDSGFPDTNLL